MLSIQAIQNDGEYYLREDYYLKGGAAARWLGGGAEALGLRGAASREELKNVLRGMSPDGTQPWLRHAGTSRWRPGYDLTFQATKGASVLWGVGSEFVRTQAELAHSLAVEAAIGFAEDTSVFTRMGKAGALRIPCKLVAPTARHGTSRTGDCTLHDHVLVSKIVVRPDGRFGAIWGRGIYRAKMAIGAIYRAELSRQLEHLLGVRIVRTGTWFDLADVPDSVKKAFSTRRQEILEYLDEAGQSPTDARAAAAAAVRTRQAKREVSPEELRETWRETAREHGFGEEQVEAILWRQEKRIDLAARAQAAVEEGIAKVSEAQSHFSERDLVRRVAEAAQGQGVGADVVRHVVRETLTQPERIVKLGAVAGEVRYTTREMMAVEKRLLDVIEQSREDRRHIARPSTVEAVLAGHLELSDEQKAAVRHLTEAPGAVQVLSGLAGTGKTLVLATCREVWERNGQEVIGAALSGKAAQGLEESAGIPSTTIHSLLYQLESGQRKITSKHTLVVDEAGMAGTRMTEGLIGQFIRAGAKVIAVGDARQLQAIEAGGPFAAMGKRTDQAELTKIQRQKEQWAREAVGQASRGEAREVLKAYAERGLLTVAEDRREARRQLVDDWKKKGMEHPEERVIFTGTRMDAAILNRMVQHERLLDGKLGSEAIEVGDWRIHTGDRVLLTRNSACYGVKNGHLGTVVEVDERRRNMTVELDGGRRVRLDMDAYEHVQLGYAITTHKGQGITVENASVLLGGEAQSRELSYVQISRARGETRLYTDADEAGEELTQLARRMHRSYRKDLAHDIQEASQQQRLAQELKR